MTSERFYLTFDNYILNELPCDMGVEEIEAARKNYHTGEINFDELIDVYENTIQFLSQNVTQFDALDTHYLTSLETLHAKKNELNKPALGYLYKGMDSTSIWLQNKQFLCEITDDKLFQIQSQIITELFGSFKQLFQKLAKHQFGILTTCQQIQLNKILTNEILNDSNTEINKLDSIETPLIDLPDDCLSHMMRFLDNYGRGTVRRCCKSLAIIVAKPQSVNDVENDMIQIIGANLYIPKMALLINSECQMDNIEGIKLFNQYIDSSLTLKSLNNYDSNMLHKIETILNTNYIHSDCQEATKDIMWLSVGYPNVFPALKYILEASEWKSSLLENIADEWISDVGFVLDAFECDGVFNALLKYGVKDKDDDDDDDDDNYNLGIIFEGIISKGYDSMTNYMLKHGLLKIISEFILHENDYTARADNILSSLLKQNISRKYIAEIIGNDVIMQYLIDEEHRDVCNEIMNNILQYANYDQRTNFINNYDVTDEMMAIINSLNDKIVYNNSYNDDEEIQLLFEDNSDDEDFVEEDLKTKPSPQNIVEKGFAHESHQNRKNKMEEKRKKLEEKLRRRPSVQDLVAQQIMPEDSEVIAELKYIAKSHKRMKSAVNALTQILPFGDETNKSVAETMMKHINDTEDDIDLLFTTSEEEDDDDDDESQEDDKSQLGLFEVTATKLGVEDFDCFVKGQSIIQPVTPINKILPNEITMQNRKTFLNTIHKPETTSSSALKNQLQCVSFEKELDIEQELVRIHSYFLHSLCKYNLTATSDDNMLGDLFVSKETKKEPPNNKNKNDNQTPKMYKDKSSQAKSKSLDATATPWFPNCYSIGTPFDNAYDTMKLEGTEKKGEYWNIQIDCENKNVSIGTSFQCINNMIITGIHCDKNCLLEQHQLLLPECTKNKTSLNHLQEEYNRTIESFPAPCNIHTAIEMFQIGVPQFCKSKNISDISAFNIVDIHDQSINNIKQIEHNGNEINKLMDDVIRIDNALAVYYQQMGIYEYKDNIGIGKYLKFIVENKLDEIRTEKQSQCGLDLITRSLIMFFLYREKQLMKNILSSAR